MTVDSNLFRFASISACAIFLAACNTSAIGEGLSTRPVASANTPTTTGGTLVPAQTVGSETALAAQNPSNLTPAQVALSEQAGGVQTAALDTTNTISFLPVSGAPQGAVTKLSRSLRESAQTSGLSLIPANQPGARYQVKGYFSALDDGSGTLLVYVWDVLDGSGNRLHRINGQERTTSKSTDPWQAVGQGELNRVAGTTVARLNSWLHSTSQ